MERYSDVGRARRAWRGSSRLGVGRRTPRTMMAMAMEEDGDAYLVRLMRECDEWCGEDDACVMRAREGGEIGVKRAAVAVAEGEDREDARTRAKTAKTTTTRDGSSASSMTMSSGDVDMAISSPLRAKLPWGGGFPADPSAAS